MPKERHFHKSSAVAEMGDRFATIDMGRKWGVVPLFVGTWGLCPFLGGAWYASNTKSPGRGLPPYQVASSSIQPFGHNRHGPKIGSLCRPFWGGRTGPHLTQSRLSRGLYLHAKFRFDPSTVWPKCTNVTDRQTERQDRTTVTVLQTLAQKPLNRHISQ